jgi:hypothetical protein
MEQLILKGLLTKREEELVIPKYNFLLLKVLKCN